MYQYRKLLILILILGIGIRGCNRVILDHRTPQRWARSDSVPWLRFAVAWK